MAAREFHPVKGQPVARVKVARSRELRQEMADSERILWHRLRGSHIGGVRFRRQQVIDGFIVDFYCHAARLVIEVDGAIHTNQADYDTARDEALIARGLRILRISNDEVMQNIEGVMERTAQNLNSRPPHS